MAETKKISVYTLFINKLKFIYNKHYNYSGPRLLFIVSVLGATNYSNYLVITS